MMMMMTSEVDEFRRWICFMISHQRSLLERRSR